MRHFNITFKPDGTTVSISAGATILEAAAKAGIILNSTCGAKGTCGKCLVTIEPSGKQVLACQTAVQDNLTVTIPDDSRFFEQKILAEGLDTRIDATVAGKYLVPGRVEQVFGIAVDIGTTTVVAKLINMVDGKAIATEAVTNPQIHYGDDVISRINYGQSDEKLAELHRTIIDCINRLIVKLCNKAAVTPQQVYEMCVVGNTTMNHIFLNLPVTQLGYAPYKAFNLDAKDVPPAQLQLNINPEGNVHTVENIAGFVGADITAVALAVDIASAEELTLAVDIGTNGEIVLGTKEKLFAASCAAGPAFEGARISCGSRAVNGAVEAVLYNHGDIDLEVIGNSRPLSICGSALIDAAAVMLDLGIIDSSGRFVDVETLRHKLPPAIISRIIKHNGNPAFCLADTKHPGSKKLALTQKDIRELQLAKAAVRAGITLLQKKIGVCDSDIKHVHLAGAFGNFIRAENALRIGLLPDVPIERIHFVGNAACSGAHMILLSRHFRDQARRLARQIEYVEIAHQPEFLSVFADCMAF
jgi:uncharacterized 2Fe-2S/4Fe-4S cluster protein (DUF4445 family)